MEPPKISLLYYKHILDEAMERFASDFETDFSRTSSGYVYSKNAPARLLKEFRKYVVDGIMSHTEDYSVSSPNFFFIISSCYPKDNILKEYLDGSKVTDEMNGQMKYFLTEDDIKVDDMLFNSVFERICDELLDGRKAKRMLGGRSRNVFVLRYDRLDCYFTYRIIRDLYGKTNTVNLFRVGNCSIRKNLRSVNDEIDSRVENLKGIIRSDRMRNVKCEIRQRIELCMAGGS